ncbi:MAG: hypothetical protein KDI61_11650 [Alphaproteobacteria bacterium]|nr:hypothetical protein [Alphaproteobacteria bacterium]
MMKGWHKKRFAWGGKEFVFRGLLTCAVTGRTVTASTQKKTYKNGEKNEWTYLRAWDPANPEKYIWVREEKVIEQIETALNSLRIPPELLEKITLYVRDTDKTERDFIKRRMRELKSQHEHAQTRLDALMDAMLDKLINREEFERQRTRLRHKQEDIEKEIECTRLGDDSFKDSLVSLLSLTARAHELFLAAQIEEKRKIINMLFANLQLKGPKLCYEMKMPFDKFATCSNMQDWSG